MSYYMHSVPGRLRIKTPLIKNSNLAAHVEKFLRQINGVESLVTNSLTGSITITYDREKVTSQKLLDTLKTRGIFDPSKALSNDQYIHSTASKAGNIVYKALLGTIVEQTLQGSPLALLGLLI
jgi:hypothetical protein